MENIQGYHRSDVDVAVVGAGHAGIEAAFAAARLGKKVALFSISLDSVADMPCNPNIGGTGKGHLVREIDALGGEMALVIDETFLQSRMLNTSKGPAIHSLRVQADKKRYQEVMKRRLEEEEKIQLVEAEVDRILVEEGQVRGLTTVQGAIFTAPTVILCTGTFLNGTILMGPLTYSSGPHNTKPALHLSEDLRAHGIDLRRFKTGTPPRINRRTVDFSQMIIQEGDREIVPFSFLNQDKTYDASKQWPCYLTRTTAETKALIEANITRSTMYSGGKRGVGPRYCPSIEDKMVRFPDHEAHQIFLEPESASTLEVYVDGMSSTMPEEVQMEAIRTLPGLEKAEVMRSAYGIEYDCIDARILTRSLELRTISGLFFAGQINGSSGYEEAACQGLMAGINAARKIDGLSPFVLDRSQAYIGVLIDDLVTKGTNEPYRMMTSRCEYRLSLRQDNADLRLTKLGYEIGLASRERYLLAEKKGRAIDEEVARLSALMVTPKAEVNAFLEGLGSSPLKTGGSLADLLRRPEISYDKLAELDPDRPSLPKEVRMEVENRIKYEGYIKKQNIQIEKFKKMESRRLFVEDYGKIHGLKKEAAQKLNQVQPESVGQASRISGVSPADINVLLVYLEQERRERQDKREGRTDHE
ncbi:tRNA uridine-5-carboxymethylaminomethyl(34) synthesis enzyme MnmG [Kallipyga massiliensis]|uniref:tRNA uridine-5-carboxymethylaminomethyl(34) synthesis enzyme MnmG n=1 Tax=Kallipyga massiliensis TaxID=1472764 RepID=UPI0004B82887|nr:tRNA uridine-5-carboxymethylaminomethyl(34) synthesis enzyme MnmG [Kallipyga massiliensis]